MLQHPRILQKRLQTEEKTPRKQGVAMSMIVFDVYYCPAFSESLLGFGVSSGEFRDGALRIPGTRQEDLRVESSYDSIR